MPNYMTQNNFHGSTYLPLLLSKRNLFCSDVKLIQQSCEFKVYTKFAPTESSAETHINRKDLFQIFPHDTENVESVKILSGSSYYLCTAG